MSEILEKTILLNLAGELEEELEVLFSSLGVEIKNEESLAGQMPEFLLIKNIDGPTEALSQSYGGASIISLGPVKEIGNFAKSNGKAILNQKIMNSSVGRAILLRLFNGKVSTKLEVNFGALLESFLTVKLAGHMNAGYLSDLVVNDASNKDFRALTIRSYIVMMSTYLAYLERAGICQYPIDLNYGATTDSYIVELVVPASQFYLEYIYPALNEYNGKNPADDLLRESLKMADLLSFTHLKKAGKLIISSMWMKGMHSTAFPSLSLNAIGSVKEFERRWKGFKKHPDLELLSSDTDRSENEKKELPGKGIQKLTPSAFANQEGVGKFERLIEFLRSEKDKSKDESEITVKRIKKMLVTYPNVEVVKKLSEVDYEALKRALENPDSMAQISRIKSQAVEDVSSNSVKKQEFIEEVMGRLGNLQLEEFQEFVRVKGKINIDGAKIVIQGENGPIDLTEDILKISGSGQDIISEELIRVKGSENEKKENFIRIKGDNSTVQMGGGFVKVKGEEGNAEEYGEKLSHFQAASSEQKLNSKLIFDRKDSWSEEELKSWENKRKKIVEKLRSKIKDMNSEDIQVEYLEQNIQEIISDELDLGNEGNDHLLKATKAISEAVTKVVVSDSLLSVSENDGKLQAEEIIAKISSAAEAELKLFQKEIGRRDEQIKRMKRLIDSMRVQIDNSKTKQSKTMSVKSPSKKEGQVEIDYKVESREEEKQDYEASASFNESINILREELEKSKNDLKERDKRVRQLEENAFRIDKNKGNYINELELKIAALNKGDQKVAGSMEEGDQEIFLAKIQTLQDENLALKNSMKGHGGQLEKLQTSLVNAKKVIIDGKKTEIEFRKLQQSMDKLKGDYAASEDQVAILANTLREHEKNQVTVANDHARTNKKSIDQKNLESMTQSLQEKDLMVTKLVMDLRKSEDQYKEINLEVKKLEQKLKMAQVHNQTLEKAKSKTTGGGKATTTTDVQLQHKVKQLEAVNIKLAENQKQAQDEVAEKKKEIMKLKQDLNTLQNAHAILERKIQNKEKAA